MFYVIYTDVNNITILLYYHYVVIAVVAHDN